MCPQNLGLNKMKEVSDGLQSQHIFRARSFIEIDSQASEQNPNLRSLRNEEFVDHSCDLASTHPGFRKI